MVRPEGAVGMARAFLVAGTGSVVTNLWKLLDKGTSVIMGDLYARLLDKAAAGGVRMAHALRHAMLKSIERDECPSVWAAFLVTGV